MKQLCQAALLSVWPSRQCCPACWAVGCPRDCVPSRPKLQHPELESPAGFWFQEGLEGFSSSLSEYQHTEQFCGLQWTQILPYYAGSTAILWQLFLHDTLFLWTDQAKLQMNKEGTVLSPTHQFNFSYFPFLAEPQSRTTCLWQASPKGRLENNFHQLSAFSIFRERTCHWPSWVGDSVWEIDKLLWHCHSAIVPTQRPLKVQRVWVLKCRQETPCPDLLGTKCQGSVWYSGGFILHF